MTHFDPTEPELAPWPPEEGQRLLRPEPRLPDPYRPLVRGYSRQDRRQLTVDVFILFAVSLVLIISFLVALS